MSNGLIKATAHCNTLQAREDWRWLSEYAAAHGKGDEAARLQPASAAGFRRIDKSIAKLKAELGITLPLCEFQRGEEFRPVLRDLATRRGRMDAE
jgi:hypothetical protein